MKKFVFTFIVLCCSAFVFAQQIPQDSLEYYRQHASNLYKNLQQEEALKLFQRIAMSGDAESAYIVASIFEKLNNAQERDK